jgi:hypothetical protein
MDVHDQIGEVFTPEDFSFFMSFFRQANSDSEGHEGIGIGGKVT